MNQWESTVWKFEPSLGFGRKEKEENEPRPPENAIWLMCQPLAYLIPASFYVNKTKTKYYQFPSRKQAIKEPKKYKF